MSDSAAQSAWRFRLRDVLNRDWDPIGGCPDDEYDSYMDGIAALLCRGAADAELSIHLEEIAVKRMGLRANSARTIRAVAALRGLGPEPV